MRGLTALGGYMGGAGVWRLSSPGQTGSRRPSFGLFEDKKNDRNARIRTDQHELGCERGTPPICAVGVPGNGRGVAPLGGRAGASPCDAIVGSAAAVLAELVPRVLGFRRARDGWAGVRAPEAMASGSSHYARGPSASGAGSVLFSHVARPQK